MSIIRPLDFTFTANAGVPFDADAFAASIRAAGALTPSQDAALRKSLRGYDPQTLQVSRPAGGTIWVKLLTKRGGVWTWSVGTHGKTSGSHHYLAAQAA